MTEPRHKVAGTACLRHPWDAMVDDRGWRAVLLGKPIRRIKKIVDLCRRIRLGAARNVPWSRVPFRWLNLVWNSKRPRKVPARSWLRILRSDGRNEKQSEHQHPDEIFHDGPIEPFRAYRDWRLIECSFGRTYCNTPPIGIQGRSRHFVPWTRRAPASRKARSCAASRNHRPV